MEVPSEELAINVFSLNRAGATYLASAREPAWRFEEATTAADLCAANAHDPVVLEAVARLVRGESQSELVGFSRLEVA